MILKDTGGREETSMVLQAEPKDHVGKGSSSLAPPRKELRLRDEEAKAKGEIIDLEDIRDVVRRDGVR